MINWRFCKTCGREEGDGWEGGGRRVGGRRETGGREEGDGWEGGGRRVGGRRETGGREEGDGWEGGGRREGREEEGDGWEGGGRRVPQEGHNRSALDNLNCIHRFSVFPQSPAYIMCSVHRF